MQFRPLLPLLGQTLPNRRRAVATLTAAGAGLLACGAAIAVPVDPPPSPADTATVRIAISGLRSAKGLVQVCMTRLPKAFPACTDDPAARKATVPASQPLDVTFGRVAAGTWAIAVLHDENGNGKADRALLIPREGFGFSRDAPVRFGPPSFAAAAFPVGGHDVVQAIHMRYML